MDYDQAIMAHTKLKTRLRNYIRNPDRSIVATEIVRDDVCELGCWISGHRKSYARLPAFAKLQAVHTAFHRAAAEIIVRANAGDHIDDAVTFGATSAFGLKSMEVVETLLRLRQQAKEAGI